MDDTENNNRKLPFEIEDHEVGSQFVKDFPDRDKGYVRAGPQRYILPGEYRQAAWAVYTMPLRPSDIFLLGFPRSGTTWAQELIWLVANDLDFEKANSVNLSSRYTFLEAQIFNPHGTARGVESVGTKPSPRFIKSHLALSLLPPTLLDRTRAVYMARDPRDVAVSSHNYLELTTRRGFNGTLKRYWNYFFGDTVPLGPYFEHLMEAWQKRHHPNLLILFYEELSQDLPGAVRRVARFLGKQISEDGIRRLCAHLNIATFRQNPMVNNQNLVECNFFKDSGFIRKGKTGAWQDEVDEEMRAQACAWMARNLRGTDLRFPGMEDPFPGMDATDEHSDQITSSP